MSALNPVTSISTATLQAELRQLFVHMSRLRNMLTDWEVAKKFD